MPFDANDPDTKAALKAAVDEAVAAANADFDDKSKRLLDDLKKAKAAARAASEIKPEDVAAIEAERDKALADLTAATKAAKDATTLAEKATKALETEQGFTQKLLISDGLKTALIANGVKDETYLDDLTAAMAGKASVKVDGDTRVAMYGDKPLDDHIKEWAGTDAGKKYVAAPNNGGGGAPGGKGAGEAGKTMTRTAFDALDQGSRAKFSTEGGKVVDEAA